MKHYFVQTSEFIVPLKQYLKQQGLHGHYDGIKRKITRKFPDTIGDFVLKTDSEFLTILDASTPSGKRASKTKKEPELANEYQMG